MMHNSPPPRDRRNSRTDRWPSAASAAGVIMLTLHAAGGMKTEVNVPKINAESGLSVLLRCGLPIGGHTA